MIETLPHLNRIGFPTIAREELRTLQVNLGYRCNQRCRHCHVAAGPHRQEMMSPENVAVVIDFLASAAIDTLDLTGGAPELHPLFRRLVTAARRQGVRVVDRCNLTVLEEPGQEQTARFLADCGVEIVASLPCYLPENVDRQRGVGVFDASIRVLRRLNALGYGRGGDLRLNLVYNPQGAVLPPEQKGLEARYKEELGARYGIAFDRLFVITNMPIRRFGSTLLSRQGFDDYMALLHAAFRPDNLDAVMCRGQLSIDWQGMVYDCDFNQMLGLPAGLGGGSNIHLSQVDPQAVCGAPIRVLDHCYGCTAGQGSSCGGALEGDGA
ncbi:MAG: radical SAM/Cys-rich domain protein [Zetaproteobacteria bacterium]|nr:MAG: radical SAM/Cys-rich domain protein [Zetaproteobacteria bacterium]